MKKLLLLIVLLSLSIACSGRKEVEKAVNSGNYDQAINTALKKLRTNKDSKRKHDVVLMLQDAYYKAEERDLNDIEHLKKDKNPELYRRIYEQYLDLNARQEAIKPILPLNVNGKNIPFKFNNYSNSIIESRENLSDFLYAKGIDLLESDDKHVIRDAYNTLKYLERVNPNYENTRELLNEAHQRGTDYILVSINNETEQVIPTRLEDDLLNFDTYGLNKFWSVYHANIDKDINYDYAMHLNLKRINISPESVKERQFIREKEVADGWKYKLDAAGNVAKDSLGNDQEFVMFDLTTDSLTKLTCDNSFLFYPNCELKYARYNLPSEINIMTPAGNFNTRVVQQLQRLETGWDFWGIDRLLNKHYAKGIGLIRTEFFYFSSTGTQYWELIDYDLK